MSDKIRCLLVRCGAKPEEIYINRNFSLKELQQIVEGYIECLTFKEADNNIVGVTAVINEEGKFLCEPNRELRYSDYRDMDYNDNSAFDILCGNIILIGHNDEGDWEDLPTEEIDFYKKRYAEPLTTQEVEHYKKAINTQSMIKVFKDNGFEL